MNKYGKVIWITGLSGSGKSTLGKEVVARLRSIDNTVLMLDGDEMPEMFGTIEVNSSWAEVDGEKDLLLYNKDPFLSQQWKDALIKENL